MSRSLVRIVAILFAALLAGCGSLQSKPAPVPRPAQPLSAAFALNGRISINHQGKHHSAGLRWTHRLLSDEILLFAPLGKTAARIYRDDGFATLDDGDGHYRAENAEALMDEVLGWHLPLGGLHQWVLGLADTDDAARIERDALGRISVLDQSGWSIHFLGYVDDRQDSLPARMNLVHEDLQIRLVIDEWEWNPQ